MPGPVRRGRTGADRPARRRGGGHRRRLGRRRRRAGAAGPLRRGSPGWSASTPPGSAAGRGGRRTVSWYEVDRARPGLTGALRRGHGGRPPRGRPRPGRRPRRPAAAQHPGRADRHHRRLRRRGAPGRRGQQRARVRGVRRTTRSRWATTRRCGRCRRPAWSATCWRWSGSRPASRRSHRGLSVTVLRPAVVLGAGDREPMAALLSAPRLLRIRGAATRWQFCHVADLAAAVEVAALAPAGTLDGPANVACEGWLTHDELERVSGRRSLELPERVAVGTAERLHRLGLTPGAAERAGLPDSSLGGGLRPGCARRAGSRHTPTRRRSPTTWPRGRRTAAAGCGSTRAAPPRRPPPPARRSRWSAPPPWSGGPAGAVPAEPPTLSIGDCPGHGDTPERAPRRRAPAYRDKHVAGGLARDPAGGARRRRRVGELGRAPARAGRSGGQRGGAPPLRRGAGAQPPRPSRSARRRRHRRARRRHPLTLRRAFGPADLSSSHEPARRHHDHGRGAAARAGARRLPAPGAVRGARPRPDPRHAGRRPERQADHQADRPHRGQDRRAPQPDHRVGPRPARPARRDARLARPGARGGAAGGDLPARPDRAADRREEHP